MKVSAATTPVLRAASDEKVTEEFWSDQGRMGNRGNRHNEYHQELKMRNNAPW